MIASNYTQYLFSNISISLILLHPPTSTLFPYTTLFRSHPQDAPVRLRGVLALRRPGRVRPARVRHRGRNTRPLGGEDRKSTRLNSSHLVISYAVFCLKKKIIKID